jgi:hypothetical protein
MKKILLFFAVLCCAFLYSTAIAQVTNLKVDSSGSNFTMTSGDVISWSYNVPNGSTTFVEIYYDVNGNQTIDAGDVLWQSFGQIDGDSEGTLNGPPDMDGTVNGSVKFSQPVGIAPGKYIMKFTANNQSTVIAGTVSHLSSPVYTVSGTISPPAGKSAANIFVQINRDGHQPDFWDGITDSSGNYSIEMNGDTAGNPWRASLVSNPFKPDIVTPQEDTITIAGNVSNVNFSIITVAAQVAGIVEDENGNPISYANIELSNANNSNSTLYHFYNSNLDGTYQIGLTSSDLNFSKSWQVNVNLGFTDSTQNFLLPIAYMPTINPGDSIYKKLILFSSNSDISGTIKIDGSAPGYPITIVAYNQDTAQAIGVSNGATGNFSLHVTNKIYNYKIFPINLSQNYYYQNVIAHAGDSAINLDLSTTTLAVQQSSNGLPKGFALMQNYPNPFNPSTSIKYALPTESNVRIIVYNLIGQKITELVNGTQTAGYHEVTFNANYLSSGIYFYKIIATSKNNTKEFVVAKKMLLLK